MTLTNDTFAVNLTLTEISRNTRSLHHVHGIIQGNLLLNTHRMADKSVRHLNLMLGVLKSSWFCCYFLCVLLLMLVKNMKLCLSIFFSFMGFFHCQEKGKIQKKGKKQPAYYLVQTALPHSTGPCSILQGQFSSTGNSENLLVWVMFVIVNFDAVAQANDIQIKRRQVVFLCWMQDLNPGSQTPNRQQTECSLTNRLSYRGSS